MSASRRSQTSPGTIPPSLSARNRPPPPATNNLLLAALPRSDYDRILSQLESVPLPLKHVLQKPNEPVRYVYFPGGGFCSILTVLENGRMVEVATVGREGMVGIAAVLGGEERLPSTTMVQAESDLCQRMSIAAFRREMNRRGAFARLLTQYAQAHLGFVMQSTACNAVHTVEQRLARWLLTARDRVGRDDFPLTQEFVAMMLGASRPTVTVVAGALQKGGMITYHHGVVQILKRAKLEAMSCECYRVTENLLAAVTAT